MIEAYQIEHRPFLYFFLRRFELVRWTLNGKVFHAEAKWYAPLLALLLALMGYEYERCCFCGWKVSVVWWCDDQILWETVTGYTTNGVLCIQCFDRHAERKGLSVKWQVGPLCGYTNEEWLRIIQDNQQQVRQHSTPAK